LSPLAFAAYGMLCIKLSDRDAAFRFGELSLELLEKFQVREYIPRVYAAYYACIHSWKHPIRDSLDHLLHAYRSGMQTGDIEYSLLCANLWCFISFDSGLPIDEIERQWTTFQSAMKSYRQTSLLQMSVPCLQNIRYYQGKDVDFSDTETVLQHCCERNFLSCKDDILWCQAKTAFLFGDLDRADELADTTSIAKNSGNQMSSPSPEIVYIAFLNGMIAFSMVTYQECNIGVPTRRTRRQYMREGKNMIRFIKKYALWCPVNFVDKKFLLKAELAAVNRRSEQALEYYICAIALAKDTRSLFVQALANERAGRYCFMKLNQPHKAVSFFVQSLLVYEEWAAHRKVNHLRAELKGLFGTDEYGRWFINPT
jgi:histidine kinase